jgi:soluble lytic murein transglycosylase-like protein
MSSSSAPLQNSFDSYEPKQELESPFLNEEYLADEARIAQWRVPAPGFQLESPFLEAFEEGWRSSEVEEFKEFLDELDEEEFEDEANTIKWLTANDSEMQNDEVLSDLEDNLNQFYGDKELAYLEDEAFIDKDVLQEEELFFLEGSGVAQEEAVFDEEFFTELEDRAIAWASVESEQGSLIPTDIVEFATNLGKEWSQRRNGSTSAEEMTKWLLQDYQDTLKGARHRFKEKYATHDIVRAWMVSRQEQMNFQLSSSADIKPLQNFVPPSQNVLLVSSKLIDGSNKAPVAPIIVKFVEVLYHQYLGNLGVSTYQGHGGGKFDNRGYSLDLFIKGLDSRGFYKREDAIKLLQTVQEVAKAVHLEWRVIYNDFSVAEAINRETGQKHVIFMGTVRRDKNKRVIGLNWHGPAPLILHFHIDLVPRMSASNDRGSFSSVPNMKPTPKPSQGVARSTTELVRFVQQVLNATEGERLDNDGSLGKLTNGALERFRKKYNLGVGGILDDKTQLALTQRALEEIAQQSIFPQLGILDAKTEQALITFKTERRLGFDATLNASTRKALTDYLVKRKDLKQSSSPPSSLPTERRHSTSITVNSVQVSSKVIAAVKQYQSLADDAARKYGVEAALILGVIAAESGGDKNLVAKSGYTGLMQSDKGEAYKQPEISINAGTKKLNDFRKIMEGVLEDSKRSYGQLPEQEQLRLLALAYNAGPVTVAKALQYASESGSPERWLDAEHYKRALLFTGAYSLKQAEAFCLKNMSLSEQKSYMLEAVKIWNYWRLGNKKTNWRKLNDPPVWKIVSAGLPAFILCAIDFKHRNSPKYAAKILAYRDRFRLH